MKAFVGIRDSDGTCHLYLKDSENLTKIPPDRSQAVYNHSPDGYEWGYGGSGPSQLALAIMLEVTNDDRKALSLYYDFKYDVIAGLADEEWILPLKQIERWIAAQQEEDALDDIPY